METSNALERVNVAVLIKHIKASLSAGFDQHLFELNTPELRNSVYEMSTRFLDELMNRRSLYDFAVVCDNSNNTAESIAANQLIVDIAIKVKPGGDFYYLGACTSQSIETILSELDQMVAAYNRAMEMFQ